MGKDKHGEYLPPKGKPSGNGKEEGHVMDPFAGADDPELDNEISAKYLDSETGEPDANVHMLHANRHLHKGEDLPEFKDPEDDDE